MVEQYCHLLIAQPKDATPTGQQVQGFLEELVRLETVPSPQECVLRTPSGFREVPNPFTGETISMPTKKSRPLNLAQIASALQSLTDYELTLAGEGSPGLPPLPLFGEVPHDYWVCVNIVVSSRLRSTSDTYYGFNPPRVHARPFGTPCDDSASTGYFSNLHTGAVIEVPEAGAARFWIEIQLGKFLFPPILNDLRILNPTLVSTAKRIFEIAFAQGCHWIA